MNRSRLVLGLLAICLAVVVSAMAWVSVVVVDLDRRDAKAQRQAELEEDTRLALWRMDSALGPLIAQEDTRPYYEYRSFYSPTLVFDKAGQPLPDTPVVVASPLLLQPPPFIKLHFQIDPQGTVSSPQVPNSVIPESIERQIAKSDPSAASLETLQRLTKQLKYSTLLNKTPRPDGESRVWPSAVNDSPADTVDRQSVQMTATPSNAVVAPSMPNAPVELQQQDALRRQKKMGRERNAPAQQTLRSNIEYQQRVVMNAQSSLLNTLNRFSNNSSQAASEWDQSDANAALQITTPPTQTMAVREGAMKSLWLDDRLMLVRQVEINSEVWLQGCLLDWTALQSWLLDRITDLLPNAQLVATADSVAINQSTPHRLAMLPVLLEPGSIQSNGESLSTPIRTSLLVAWSCTLLAVVAVGILAIGMTVLSERRAAFVSAVTHELRTPLTTFRMYTEMLTGGMVSDESRRVQYLETLQVESDRLSRLVENVLSFARLERRRTELHLETLSVGTLLQRFIDRFRQRADQSDMDVCVEINDATKDVVVRTDVVAVEQVLFNLVDNACKYAGTAQDRRIHVVVSASEKAVSFEISDHGPGLDRDAARRLFRPFGKSAQAAAKSVHGVGLGLALSHRLARRLKGHLIWQRSHAGGCSFVLNLPRNRSRG